MVSSFCAILAVGRFDAVLIAHPMYLFTVHGAIALAMLLGRTRRRSPSQVSMEQVF